MIKYCIAFESPSKLMYLNFVFIMEQYRYTISSYEYQISSKKTLLSTHVFVDYHLESLVLDEIVTC